MDYFCRRKEKTVIKKNLKVKTEDVVGLLNLFPTAYQMDIGVVKKSRERNVHCVNENHQLCNILGKKWYERIPNMNGDFCYVVSGTVQFWLHEKNPVTEFVYIGNKLFESHIQNDLELIFTFVRGDGVKAQYVTDLWK